jgi:hydrogenase nickel incorporation protein HypA/HybF
MHELSIAESILDAVRRELATRPGATPVRVGLRVGELAAIDVDSLSFCFDAILRGTAWEGLQLDARICPQRRICGSCGNEFAVIAYAAACPACASLNTRVSSGDELDFDYLEVETNGTAGAEDQSTEREPDRC